MGPREAPLPSPDAVEGFIRLIRGEKVILDADIAALYGVSVKALKQAVKRNLERFPEDFMFQLSWDEARRSRSQFVTLISTDSRTGHEPVAKQPLGSNLKYRPYAFTEQGVAMLSAVLRSPRAIRVNIEIMRAFVRLRGMLSRHKELAGRLDELEKKYDGQFKVVFDALRALMDSPADANRRRIGFHED